MPFLGFGGRLFSKGSECLHARGDALAQQRHEGYRVAVGECRDAAMVGEEKFVESGQQFARERLRIDGDSGGMRGVQHQIARHVGKFPGRRGDDPPRPDAEKRRTFGRAELSEAVAPYGDVGPLLPGPAAGEQVGGFVQGGGGLRKRQVVIHRHGVGCEAAQRISVVERNACREQPFFACGRELDAYESRYGSRVALRGGQGLDPCGQTRRIGGVCPGENRACRSVEHGDMLREVADTPPREV